MNMSDFDDASDQQYAVWVRDRKSVSCKLRNKECEAHDLPCDCCSSYQPIKRQRRN